MHASSACIACIFGKQDKRIRQFDDEGKKSEYMHRVLEILYKHGQSESSPWLAEQIDMLYESYSHHQSKQGGQDQAGPVHQRQRFA